MSKKVNPEFLKVGQILRAARIRAGYSYRRAAKASDMSFPFIHEVEKGLSDISFTRVLRLCKIYKISVAYIELKLSMS